MSKKLLALGTAIEVIETHPTGLCTDSTAYLQMFAAEILRLQRENIDLRIELNDLREKESTK